MNTTVEKQVSKLDQVKWALIAILLVGGIVANSYFANQSMLLRLVGWVVLAAVAVFLVFQTAQGRRLWMFLQDAQIELRKVVWPTRQETTQSTLVVVVMVVVTALFLWGIDSLLMWLVGLITR